MSPQAYTHAGPPWFDYYNADAADLPASDTLAGVKPVGNWLGADTDAWVAPTPGQTIGLGDTHPDDPVSDGAR